MCMRASRHSTVAQPATRVDTTCWQLFRPDINTTHFYFLLQKSCQITWLRTGWKNFLYFRRPPWGVRPVAFATSATWLIRYWWRQQQTVNWPDWPVQRREVQLTSASQLNTSWDPSVTFYARSSWLSEKCRPIVWTVDCNCRELFKLYTVSIILVVARSGRNTRH